MRSSVAIYLITASCSGIQNDPTPPAPPFAQSGVIEGFYGPPWSHQDRLDILRFMGRVGLRSYFYAPKNDPYHRQRWREPYPATARQQLQELVDSAREHGVEFHYAISPGLSIVYSDASDYQTLFRKLDSVAAMGVRRFALLLDDVSPNLVHEQDRATFATLADAHVDLINRLHRDLTERGATLSVTPTTYTGAWGNRSYVRRLGEGVDARVPLFWTGIDVASPEITAPQAREWGELISRQPLVWDNYPVNDFARWRLFLGPLRGRASDLSTEAAGIIANPMNEAHASMIPLATIADYARDPAHYDPERALRRTVEALYGSDAAEHLTPFVELYGDYGWEDNLFEPLFIPGAPIASAAMEAGLARLSAALSQLEEMASAGDPELQVLVSELEPFVTRTAARLREFQNDRAYARRGDQLVYRTELDRVTVGLATTSIRVDGHLGDWPAEAWFPLVGPDRDAAETSVAALVRYGQHLYVALRVHDPHVRVEPDDRVGEGDHVALVVESEPPVHRRYLTPEDLVILLPAPEGPLQPTPLIRSMRFEGFMAKFLADNQALTFSEFLVSTFGTAPSSAMAAVAEGLRYRTQLTPNGYDLEMAIPLGERDTLRMSLTVVDAQKPRPYIQSLARRNYPANPATFSTVVIR